MTDAIDRDVALRLGAMRWLGEIARLRGDRLRRGDVADFWFDGRRFPLLDPQRGITKPAGMDAALSIRTVYTPSWDTPPYEDAEGPDGLIRYAYRGDDPEHPENRGLRRAKERGLPLIWFVGVATAVYTPVFPVWIVDDEPAALRFTVAVDEAQRYVPRGVVADADTRAYILRLTRQRLHQPVFRQRVMEAYERRCAVCRLGHSSLLDAAHIVADSRPRGLAVVPNGLALCKIHHAAFDQHILGVTPDLAVEIRADILHEIDGPMLRHGLQEMAGVRLVVPGRRSERPDRDLVAERYQEFRAAGPASAPTLP